MHDENVSMSMRRVRASCVSSSLFLQPMPKPLLKPLPAEFEQAIAITHWSFMSLGGFQCFMVVQYVHGV